MDQVPGLARIHAAMRRELGIVHGAFGLHHDVELIDVGLQLGEADGILLRLRVVLIEHDAVFPQDHRPFFSRLEILLLIAILLRPAALVALAAFSTFAAAVAVRTATTP